MPVDVRVAKDPSKLGSGMLHPRCFGLVVAPITGLYRYDSSDIVAMPLRISTTTSEKVVAGVPVVEVAFSIPANVKTATRFELAPSKGHGMLHGEIRQSFGDQIDLLRDTLDCTYKQWGEGENAFWYPSVCEYRRTIGEELKEHSITTVLDVSLNESDAPDRLFTIEGLGLSEGRLVNFSDGPIKVWKDGRLQERRSAAPSARPGPLQLKPESRTRRLYMSLGMACLFAGLSIFFWRFRSRTPPDVA